MRREIKTVGVAKPNFARLKLTSKHYQRHFWNAMNYAHVELSAERLKKESLLWAKSNDYPMDILNRTDKGEFCTVGKVFFILNNEGEVTDKVLETTLSMMTDIVERNKEVKQEKKETPKVAVNTQERIYDKACECSNVIDHWIDLYINDEIDNILEQDLSRLFAEQYITHAHAQHLSSFYDIDLYEYKTALKGDDRDIAEAYAPLGKIKIKRLIRFYESIQAMCQELIDEYIELRKANQKSPEELVSKMKYAKSDKKFGMVSCPPADIIGAKGFWVFNLRTKKIGKYVCKDDQGLTVRGSSIVNFDEDNSVEKTLFKALTKIKPFKLKTLSKIQSAYDEVDSLETKMTGKMNEHCLIFKIIE